MSLENEKCHFCEKNAIHICARCDSYICSKHESKFDDEYYCDVCLIDIYAFFGLQGFE